MKIKNATAILAVLLTVGSIGTANASDFTINLNGEETAFVNTPFLMEDYIMMPVRETAEKYSYKVSWNEKNETIELLKVDSTCILKPDSDEAIINERTIKLSKPVTVVDGYSYAPISFFKVLADDVNVGWDYDKGILSISSSAIRAKDGLFAQPVVEESAATSLLSGDGTFEDGTTQNWVRRGAVTSVNVTDKTAHKGKYSLVLNSPNPTAAMSCSTNIKSVLEANGPGKYKMSFWAKTSTGTMPCRVCVAKINNSQEFFREVEIGSQWKKYSVEVELTWTNLESANSIIFIGENKYNATDELYLDDIVFTKQ